MFTIRHIRTMLTTSLGLTKSGVKWMAEAPAASSPVDDLKDQLKNASNPQELQKLHKQVMKLAQENNTNRAAITKMFEDLGKDTSLDAAKTTQIQALKTRYDQAQALLAVRGYEEQAEHIMDGTTEQLRDYRAKIGLDTQAQAIVAIIAKNEGDIDSYDARAALKNLKDVNLASLFRLIQSGVDIKGLLDKGSIYRDGGDQFENSKMYYALKQSGYTSDGALGATETKAVYDFLQYYTKLNTNSATTKVLNQLGTYYANGLDSTVYLRDTMTVGNLDKAQDKTKALTEYLASTYSDGVMSRSNSLKIFEDYLSKDKNIQTLGTALGLNGNISVDSIITALQNNPSLKATLSARIEQGIIFLQNTRAKGGSFSTKMLDTIISNKLGDIVEKRNEQNQTDIEKKIDEKISDAILFAENNDFSKNSLSDEDRKNLEKTIADIKANREPMKREFLRLVSTGLVGNVGHNANSLGYGATAATPIDGLTVSIGAGIAEGGKVGGGLLVRYGGEKVVSEDNEKKISVSGGIDGGLGATGVFIGADVGVKYTERINIFGGGGFQDAKEHGINLFVTKGFGTLTYSQMDNREATVVDYGTKLRSALSRVAYSSEGITKDALKTALLAEGLKIDGKEGEVRLASFAQEVTGYLKNNGGENASPATKFMLLDAFTDWKTNQLIADEGSNTVDGRNFAGWTVGVGSLMGIVFPVGGFAMSKMNVEYTPVAKEDVSKIKEPGKEKDSGNNPETLIPLAIAADIGLPESLRTEAVVNFILRSRDRKEFQAFQTKLTKENDRVGAYNALGSYLEGVEEKGSKTDKKIASDILVELKRNSDKDNPLLSQIDSFSSGDEVSRKLGDMGSEAALRYIESHPRTIEKLLQNRLKSATTRFPGFDWSKMYTVENLRTAIVNRQTAPNKDFFGSIDYHQSRGAANGLDQLFSGGEIYGKTEVQSPTQEQKNTLIDEFQKDHPDRWMALRESFGVADEKNPKVSNDDLKKVLRGESGVTVDGRTVIIKEQPKVYMAMAGIPFATCFNATAYMELPEMALAAAPGKSETPIDGTDVLVSPNQQNHSMRMDYYGLAGYGEKPEEAGSGGGGAGSKGNPDNTGSNPNTPSNQQDQ